MNELCIMSPEFSEFLSTPNVKYNMFVYNEPSSAISLNGTTA